MKAIILAAGKGERLGKLTKSIPKPMLQVRKKPILEHNIEWLRNYGIRDFYINLHHLSNVIQNYFDDGKKWDVNIQYSYESKLLGTAGAVRKIFEDYKLHSPFLVVYGDNLFEYDLEKIINFHQEKNGIATIAVYKKQNVNQSGIVLLDNENRIIKFIEKPKPDEVVSHLVNTGLYILKPNVLDYIPINKTMDFGKEVFPEIIKRGENIFGVILKGNLTAIDTPFLYNQREKA